MATVIRDSKVAVQTASWLDVMAGLWLIAAPFLLEFSAVTGAMWNSVIFGAAIVMLAALRGVGEGYKHAWPSWINTIIGLWLIVAPFTIGFAETATATWNSIIMGAVVVVLSVWGALSTPKEERI